MELEQLRLFLAVADSGGFSRAARRLYISHSTVSRAVSSLEEELGVRLFERTNRTVGLTDAGELLLSEARGIVSAADGIKDKLSSAK